MAWPQATDYNAAVQAPALCFADPDLRQGQVAGDLFGLPRPHAGNFADVYQVHGSNGAAWAVKCFTRPVENLRQRYQAISDHLRQEPRPFMVDFVYLEEGIRVRGQWYPVLKMKWVEGLRLNEFVAEHLDKPPVLERLAQMWARLAQELRAARMGHGDLQHGNVLLVPGSKASLLALKLIDYDGMFVPALADQPSGEVGHPNYQHPQRLAGGQYAAEVDRFAHLVICTALRCLCAGGAALWQRHDSGENLLFREDDFRNPAKSKLWPDLCGLKDAEARALAGHLLLASQGPALAVPTLDEVIGPDRVRPLSASEEAQLRALLPAEQARSVAIGADAIPPLPVPLAGIAGAAAKQEAPTAAAPAAEVAPDSSSDTATVAAAATERETPAATEREMQAATGRRSSPDLVLPDKGQAARKKRRAIAANPAAPPPLPAQVALFLRSPRVRVALAASCALGLLLLFAIVWALRPTRPPPPPPQPEPPRPQALAPATLRGGEERIASSHRDTPSPIFLPPSESQTLPAAVGPPRPTRLPYLVPPGTLEIEPGQNARLRAELDRRGYRGPVELVLSDLPGGVTCEPASLDGEQAEGEVEVRVGADVAPGEYAAHLLARVKDETVHDVPLTLRVVKPGAVGVPPPKPRPDLPQPQTLQFIAADRVTLHGLLYPGPKRKQGACVLLVHDLGQPHRGSELAGLARALQAAGHTVLQFDLRGHGDSKEVAVDFWKVSLNRSLPGYRAGNSGGRPPSIIAAGVFPAEYYPWLIHDLAAARAILDDLHDDSDSPVHADNLVVVGVGEGATLSALWLAGEFRRYAARPGFGGAIPELEKEPEIKRVRGAVWLSMAATLGRREMSSLPEWLKDAGRHGEVPMSFLFGADDDAGAARNLSFAQRIEDKPGSRPLAVVRAIPETALAGTDLLQADLETEKTILACVEAAVQERQAKWAPRGYAHGESFWHFPDTAPLPAKLRGPRGLQLIPLDRLHVRFPSVKVR
jgi:hypothetical protein